ncbi:MAG: hypothetical protein ACK2UW_01825 [Anaerolineales bacterium]|jgi:zinc transporter ZupT
MLIIAKIDRPTLGALSAFSAGALVYVGASYVLPAVKRENEKYTFLAMAAGIFVAIIVVLLKG